MTDPTRTSIVLVHGSFVDAGCWDEVAESLRRRGHQVETVDLHRGSLIADIRPVQGVVDEAPTRR